MTAFLFLKDGICVNENKKARRSSMRQGIVLLFILIILFCTSSYGGTFGGGSGTLNDPYRISEPAHLVELANTPGTPFPNYCYYCLTQNIDMTGIDITPIGYPFYGSFDGNGHTISNLTIDGAYESAGLFGQVGSVGGESTGNILNLHVENVSISGIKVAGAIAGNLYRGSIINCSSSGSVHATGTFFNDGAWAGGIAGSLWDDGTIQKCTSNCSVTALDDIGGSCAGGISAEVRGNVSDCYSTGLINARYAGGLFSTIFGEFISCNISNCYSAVTFDEDCYGIGGISYHCSDGTFTN
jgi:hypothetical protein